MTIWDQRASREMHWTVYLDGGDFPYKNYWPEHDEGRLAGARLGHEGLGDDHSGLDLGHEGLGHNHTRLDIGHEGLGDDHAHEYERLERLNLTRKDAKNIVGGAGDLVGDLIGVPEVNTV